MTTTPAKSNTSMIEQWHVYILTSWAMKTTSVETGAKHGRLVVASRSVVAVAVVEVSLEQKKCCTETSAALLSDAIAFSTCSYE